jgi:hypothetical protein
LNLRESAQSADNFKRLTAIPFAFRASTTHRPLNFSHKPRLIFLRQLVFPDSQHPPAVLAERPGDETIQGRVDLPARNA